MKFKPEDFSGMYVESDPGFCRQISEDDVHEIVEIANAKLQEWLDAAPNAFKYKGQQDECMWEQCQYMAKPLQKEVLSHRAKLVCIEDIK